MLWAAPRCRPTSMVTRATPSSTNAEEAEVEWFYEDLQDLLELTPRIDVWLTLLENSRVFQIICKEAEVEQFYEDLQDLLELTPKKDALFIIGDWNAKVEVQKHLE